MKISRLPAAWIATLACAAATLPVGHAQNSGNATPRERAGAVAYGQHCSACHGVRLMKSGDAHDITGFAAAVDEERFARTAKIARGAMPSFARTLTDQTLGDIHIYVKRGHTPDLDDVPMESNH